MTLFWVQKYLWLGDITIYDTVKKKINWINQQKFDEIRIIKLSIWCEIFALLKFIRK